jgi:hypothetical protein
MSVLSAISQSVRHIEKDGKNMTNKNSEYIDALEGYVKLVEKQRDDRAENHLGSMREARKLRQENTELKELIQALRAGDRIKAIMRFRTCELGSLQDGMDFVNTLLPRKEEPTKEELEKKWGPRVGEIYSCKVVSICGAWIDLHIRGVTPGYVAVVDRDKLPAAQRGDVIDLVVKSIELSRVEFDLPYKDPK